MEQTFDTPSTNLLEPHSCYQWSNIFAWTTLVIGDLHRLIKDHRRNFKV